MFYDEGSDMGGSDTSTNNDDEQKNTEGQQM